MHINGHTRVFLVLGHPVGQVRAPEVFNPLFQAHGVDAVLVPADVAPAQLGSFVRGALSAANIDGLWLTIPHKAAVLDLLDRVDPLGTRAGAVNAVRRLPDGSLEGGLFDGIGLVKALDHLKVTTVGRRVLLVGTGGAGMAIAVSLAERALGTLDLFDAAPGRATMLAQRLQAQAACPVRAAPSGDPAGYDVVVHATPLGLQADDPLPFDVHRLDPAATVIDILMKPHATPLQRACAARDIICHPGFEMLAQQVPDYLQFFGYPDIAAAVQGDLDPVRRNLQALV
ncbi:shikimate dehydrogenase [Sphaerotilus sp.]|uniref:shikimate dehydrogenase family protein n=1 Tax=Sphaerotilus sp. TaxID=2093942 RepID=UPI0034E277BF